VGASSRFLSSPTYHQWQGLQHVFRYLKGTLEYTLELGGQQSQGRQPKVVGYTDADWGANDDLRRSISGYTFYFGSSLVSWSSKRQPTQPCHPQRLSIWHWPGASKEALWLQRLVGMLTGETCGAVVLNVDNSSCISLAKNPEGHERTKHIDIQFHFVRHHVALKRIKIQFCPTGQHGGRHHDQVSWQRQAYQVLEGTTAGRTMGLRRMAEELKSCGKGENVRFRRVL